MPALTLTQICERAGSPVIHFLKIDVEGHERAVLEGMDFVRFRPWIMVIEATVPNNIDKPIFEEWHAIVAAADYKLAYTDKLNRYYVASEHPELFAALSIAPDDYTYAWMLRERDDARRERDEARADLEDMKTGLRELLRP